MCDHRLLRSGSAGEIDHVQHLSDNIGALFENADYHDVTIIVEQQHFSAHKVILAARSEYFRALLFGGMRESNCKEIELKDTSATAFRHLLKYIYTGRVNLGEMTEDVVLDVLGLAHQYGFVEMEKAISEYLKAVLNTKNVCLIYDIASMYSLRTLSDTCFHYMDRNAQDIINSEAFLCLSESALCEMLARDSFCAPEVEIFNAVCLWYEKNPNCDIAKIMKNIRLTLMSLQDLLNKVRPKELVSADAILDAIKFKTEKRDMELHYRGFLTLNENIATMRHGAKLVRGEMKAALLDGDTLNYDLDRGFSRHPIDDTNGELVVELAQPSIINTARLLLWDRDMRSYSYYIDVSMDDKDWVRVVDHTKYLCRSWQNLHFPARVVRFLKIGGTHNTVNRVFHAVAFECLYSTKPFRLERGLLVPSENVATIEASACVIEGVSRSRNALINGDTKNYDWDSGYTCHQLGSGAIVVQLAQPYIIGSMRMLLWDCDDRSYSYKIEVSTDQQTWHTVADKTRENCKSWQTIVFPPRPVTFVKIVGVQNTANEVFHCVHFECPCDSLSVARYARGVDEPTPRTTSSPEGAAAGSSAMPQTPQMPLPPMTEQSSNPDMT
ncbi:BTB/POZ domain-containing protein 9-like isoform X2 [Lingula anatina]|nr:BTB/POZ domain-containing protein 9-like isoform X2 [Lingula anatina]XP_023930161.1 BTB/POZ domain-containing protein 9-like isoform X2 [Lingula anatina]|eukprot:XP_013386966.1 BTB/POZ domain-containing protein 9-like isoform X2 [Lingula anatina]